jgi:hypothetical protein
MRRILVQRRDHAERNGNDGRQDDGTERKLEGDGSGGRDHCPDGAARGQRIAELAVQQVPDVKAELLDEGLVEASTFADGLDALRIIGDVAGCAQKDQLDRVAGAIEGQRIDGQHHDQNGRNPDGKPG